MDRINSSERVRRFMRFHLLAGLFACRIDHLCRKAYRKLLFKFKGWTTDELSRLLAHFPSRGYFAITYDYFTATYMIFALAKQLLPINKIVAAFSGSDPVMPQMCYAPGRFVSAPSVVSYNTIVVAILHLGNRVIQRLSRARIANLILFLLQDEAQVRASYTEFMQESGPSCLESKMTGLKKFLRDVLCYRVEFGSKLTHIPRPNRSPEALDKTVKVYTLFFASLLLPIPFAITLITVITASIVFDWGYLLRYPGCDPEIERLFSEGKLSDWSVTVTNRRVLVGILDGIENIVLWIECDIIVLVIFPFILLVNYDLKVYWRHIHEKIVRLEEFYASGDLYHDLNSVDATQVRPLQRQLARYLSEQEIGPDVERGGEKYNAVDLEICDLQSEIADFFTVKHNSDPLVSDSLTLWMIFWMIQLSAINYAEIVEADRPIFLFHYVLPTFTLSIFTIVSADLFKLNKQILRSYPRICSIMARDKSKFKRQFTGVINCYTDRKMFAFRLFRHFPFVSATYLTIVGWTFSGCVLLQNLYKSYLIYPISGNVFE